ncbi:phage portal protein (plasmid) [Paraclostridium bifermentans]|uniref:Phage portal protein n=1 Tax=Paraclostridium bifermentans TaxID=1490 RepID=A0ABY8R752_PARBF|nr:phage portal protein [Paraclostridium bifermentans]
MKVIDTIDQGLVNAIKRSASLRGILKWKSVIREEDIKKQTDNFIKNYLDINNDGGVASTDPRYEFDQLKSDAYVPNKPQMDSSKERIYSYFGTNENIIQSKFTEEEWNAYYENTIEPVAIQLSLEFTKKIFNDRNQNHGNEIVFESNRLQYASNTTKVAVSRLLTDIGAASLDQILDIFNMPPIGGEDGSRRVQTLNMVNAAKADKYQVNEEGGEKDE